jgi:hypothetical protein
LYWHDVFRITSCGGAAVPERRTEDADFGKIALGLSSDGADFIDPQTFYQHFANAFRYHLLLPYQPVGATTPTPELTLDDMPSLYRITYVTQNVPTWPQQPFFLQDRQRTLFVTQKREPIFLPLLWSSTDGVSVDPRFATSTAWADIAAGGLPDGLVERTGSSPVTSGGRISGARPGGAPLRLLSEMSDTHDVPGGTRRAKEPVLAYSEVSYFVPGNTDPTVVSAGSDTEGALRVSRAVSVPSADLAAPPSKAVPAKIPMVDRYLFEPFYHPYVCDVVKQLQRNGLDGVLDPAPSGESAPLRRQTKSDTTFFADSYHPQEPVAHPYPVEDYDFKLTGAYSGYNWEFFFHIPITIALRLAADQRYEQSLRWFHAVFKPTEREVSTETLPLRAWKIRPFYEGGVPDSIQDILGLLQYGGTDRAILDKQAAVQFQINEWSAAPFDPHLIARLRPGAYERFVVIKYVETLINWGDQLFRRETLEAINEAIQYYVLARKILGRRPERVTKAVPSPPPAAPTFEDLQSSLDAFSNALVSIDSGTPGLVVDTGGLPRPDPFPFSSESFAFCIPPNEQLFGLWDLVEDRLFKVRHCMNIDGVVRQLPLFEPPIDPALLVKAAAAGLDLSTILDDVTAPPPIRRFRVLLQKAYEVTAEVKGLGATILSALEKRDAEELALIRARQERDVLTVVRTTKLLQIQEAKQTLKGLEANLKGAQARFDFYSNAPLTIFEENAQATLIVAAQLSRIAAQGAASTAGSSGSAPMNFSDGQSSGVLTGGFEGYSAATGASEAFSALAAYSELAATLMGNRAIQVRRADEYALQAKVAANDIAAINKQILAQTIRIQIAENELAVHDRQADNASEIEEFLKNKYTNEELYDWMIGEIATVYFQAYKLAYDLARKAERAFQFERAQRDRGFIQFGAWESLRKGLLCGERLALDLRTMESAFLEEDKREIELTRHVSLAQLDPTALVKLRESGTCDVTIPETFYDADSPGHYLRRIRSVSLTLPSVTGPYTPVRCTLTLLSSKLRMTPLTSADPARSDVPIQSVVTSSGRDDAGLFEVDPRDERYLPFEGAGAIASFRLGLPTGLRPFDYGTIQDAILHVRYTARDGGTAFGSGVSSALVDKLKSTATAHDGWWAINTPNASPLALLISLKSELADAWYRLFHPPSTAAVDVTIPLDKDRFPFAFNQQSLKLLGFDFYGQVVNYTSGALAFSVAVAASTPPASPSVALTNTTAPFGAHGAAAYGTPVSDFTAATLTVDVQSLSSSILVDPGGGQPKGLDPAKIKDLFVVVHYSLQA